MQVDLAIIGGGPAGASAAITAARRGAQVALFEARSFPRHKVCGEFVSAESLELLRDLLGPIASAADVLQRAPAINRARLFLGNRVVESPIQPAALSITRYALDALLWQAAEAAGVQAFANREVLAISGEGPFTIRTSDGECSCKSVIVAAGRWSSFTADRTLPAGPKWLGLKEHFREPHPAPSTDLYFFEHGYCGVQPVTPDVVNACAMVRSDCASTLDEVLRLHPLLAERAAGWTPLFAPVSTAPLLYRQPQPVRNNMLFCGDAAAFIDPFAGDGISIALRSGKVAAEGTVQGAGSRLSPVEAASAYQRAYARQFSPLIAAASRVRSLLELPPFARFAAFELLRLPGVMSYVVRRTRRSE